MSRTRRPKQTVRAKAGRTPSSKRWLDRQLNDPYVAAAQDAGYRSRAAFKLLQIQEKYHLLRPGMAVVDLGAAPGGWSQVAATLVGEGGTVIALDILEMDTLPGVSVLCGDFTDAATVAALRAQLTSPVDVVLSDMAAPTTGHAATDHLRVVALAEEAFAFAAAVLRPGGSFVVKVFQGGASGDLLALGKKLFRKVHHFKPPASRKESAEIYLVAEGLV
jgi:23S rRNA (uridine2552-2'-O)-methyltransferase